MACCSSTNCCPLRRSLCSSSGATGMRSLASTHCRNKLHRDQCSKSSSAVKLGPHGHRLTSLLFMSQGRLVCEKPGPNQTQHSSLLHKRLQARISLGAAEGKLPAEILFGARPARFIQIEAPAKGKATDCRFHFSQSLSLAELEPLRRNHSTPSPLGQQAQALVIAMQDCLTPREARQGAVQRRRRVQMF